MSINQSNKPQIKTIEELQEKFDEYLLLKDRNIVKVVAATIISNQFAGGYPTWIFIIAPSSGGKSEIIQAFDDIKIDGAPLVFPISDMTVNTLASGQKKVGKETSLLHQMPPGGILSFKDFTSMVSKAKEARTEIFKQLREVYDGKYIKRTGTGDNIDWVGKIGAVAGATEIIYEFQQEFATMGDRFIMYSFEQPNREEALDFILDDSRINSDKLAMQQDLRDSTSNYIQYAIENLEDEDVTLSKELKEDLKDVANFCTQVRSGVITDERKAYLINFVPSAEMPFRMIGQLLNLAKAFILMRKAEPNYRKVESRKFDSVTDDESKVLYKVAFDSIPLKRRMALKALTKYGQGATTKGIATLIGYQTPVVNAWLAQLNALGICDREAKGGNQGDKWTFKRKFRDIMSKFEHIDVIDEELVGEDEDEKSLYDQALDFSGGEMGSLDPAGTGGDFDTF